MELVLTVSNSEYGIDFKQLNREQHANPRRTTDIYCTSFASYCTYVRGNPLNIWQ